MYGSIADIIWFIMYLIVTCRRLLGPGSIQKSSSFLYPFYHFSLRNQLSEIGFVALTKECFLEARLER